MKNRLQQFSPVLPPLPIEGSLQISLQILQAAGQHFSLPIQLLLSLANLAFENQALFTIMKVAVALLLDISLMGSAAISLLFELPMSRRNELEADRIGLSLMADACFDPRAAVRVYSKLGGADRQSKYFSTHPPSSDRVEQVRSLLPAAISHYDKKNCTARRRALAL